MAPTLYWKPQTTPVALRSMLAALSKHYPIAKGVGKGIAVEFEQAAKTGMLEIERRGSTARVRYGTPAQAGRAVGALLANLVSGTCRETTPFKTLGIMLDCSRNAVMTVAHVKTWLERLALLGYNMVMLYTEDTYELPGEPYFGYQRGAYTADELRQIDAYAATLNIEVVPCIQTLGHLEKILRHGAYGNVRDTSSVLLVGEDKTYALIGKMLAHWRGVCRTRRIHIGMDETHDLGRGRYLDRFGYRHGFDLFNEHLQRVVKLCRAQGLEPMIWSDMVFRLGNQHGDYYSKDTVIPTQVVKKIPRELELVYWDYYQGDKQVYLDMIARHRALGKEPLMASGIWTWNKYWYDRHVTERNAGACVDACYEAKLKELLFTQWGDNGAYCDHDGAFAGMVWCADKSYGIAAPKPTSLEKRFAATCGGSYAAHILASEIHGCVNGFQPEMWSDPFFENHARNFAKDNPAAIAKIAKAYATLATKLQRVAREHTTGDLRYAHATAQAFAARYNLAASLLAAYRRKNKPALRTVMRSIPSVRKDVRTMAATFRTMWLSHNKPNGIETIQARFGMLDARYEEMETRLGELLAGTINSIPELDCQCPPQ